MGLFVRAFVMVLLLFVSSCTTEPLNQECCRQCLNAFSQSPVGVGPSGAICAHFLSSFAISEECENYFGDAAITVQDCKIS